MINMKINASMERCTSYLRHVCVSLKIKSPDDGGCDRERLVIREACAIVVILTSIRDDTSRYFAPRKYPWKEKRRQGNSELLMRREARIYIRPLVRACTTICRKMTNPNFGGVRKQPICIGETTSTENCTLRQCTLCKS